MSLQGYYLIISFIGWYWWGKGIGLRSAGLRRRAKVRMRKQETDYRLPYTEYLLPDTNEKPELQVTRLKMTTGLILGTIFVLLYLLMWLILVKIYRFTCAGMGFFYYFFISSCNLDAGT